MASCPKLARTPNACLYVYKCTRLCNVYKIVHVYNSRIPENANMSFTIIILSLQHKLLCEFCIIFTSHYFTYRMSCLHGGISKTSSVHFTQLPVSNMKFPYGITSYWTLMIYLEWTFKVYLCVAGFSYVRTCIRSPCKFGTRCVYASWFTLS